MGFMIKFKSQLLNKLFLVLATLVLLVLLLIFTDPNNVALPVLIAPFICIGLIIYLLTHLFIGLTWSNLNNSAVRLFALSIAFLGVSLLLLRSLHQLTLKDTLLVSGFTIAFWFYLRRADFLH